MKVHPHLGMAPLQIQVHPAASTATELSFIVMAEYGEGWAPPGAWGPWYELRAHVGEGPSPYVVEYETESQAPSTFDVEVEIMSPDGSGPTQLQTIGPGSFKLPGWGTGTDKIRFKSHSQGQVIKYIY
ncbi:colicin Z C-terminal domain-related protein [Halomonas sabkhae]|uniref:colicin Z C-terminal domain-related protein n=1 Tax=Halomonas sabkhae TaxID=626223 RepID=UPI00338F8EFD